MQFSLVHTLLFLLPLYLTNSLAVIFSGKTPLDFNILFIDEKPLLGKGKTIRGTIGAIIFTVLLCVPVSYFANFYFPNYIFISFILSLGAIFGDLAESFIKRRLNMPPGKELFPWDQIDFLIGGLIFGIQFYIPSIFELIFMFALTLILHRVTNIVAFKLKLKRVPW